jgi:cation transport ATPase
MAMVSETERAVELEIGGMTCASCAARIEKKLNKLELLLAHPVTALRTRAGC